MADLPTRKAIRIQNFEYSSPGAYFITVCTAGRENLFWQNRRGDLRVKWVIQQFKGSVTKQIGQPIWQKSYYDHAIRNEQDYRETWQHIENNPLKYMLKQAP